MKELIKLAREAKEKSYSPYSKFRVGAAVLMDDNEIYWGCNIENAAYTPTVCAERVAIFKGISNGARYVKSIAIVADTSNTYPCGVCRQVISEFANEDTKIIIANSEEDYRVYSFDEILPYSFGPMDLKKEKN